MKICTELIQLWYYKNLRTRFEFDSTVLFCPNLWSLHIDKKGDSVLNVEMVCSSKKTSCNIDYISFRYTHLK